MLAFLFVCVCFAVVVPLMLMIGQIVIGLVAMAVFGIGAALVAVFQALFGRKAAE